MRIRRHEGSRGKAKNTRARMVVPGVKDRGFMVVGRPLSELYGPWGGRSPVLSQISATHQSRSSFQPLYGDLH